jgi:transcription antitermination factor NusG
VSYWACVQSEPKREAVAQHFLTLAGYDRVYLPRLRTVHRRQGRRIDLKVPLFPGYLFVWVTTGWWAARWCPHVVRIITNGGMEPAHVADSLIESIRRQEVNGAVELPKTLGLKSGDQVRILQGPLQGHLGLYAGQRSHERVLVLLALLGGHQRVELAKDAIEVVRS